MDAHGRTGSEGLERRDGAHRRGDCACVPLMETSIAEELRLLSQVFHASTTAYL